MALLDQRDRDGLMKGSTFFALETKPDITEAELAQVLHSTASAKVKILARGKELGKLNYLCAPVLLKNHIFLIVSKSYDFYCSDFL